MSTYTRATSPIQVIVGRPWTLPLTWRDPDGVGIDITTFTITASLVVWAGDDVALTVTKTDAPNGKFKVAVNPVPASIAASGVKKVELKISITAASDETHDLTVPVTVIKP